MPTLLILLLLFVCGGLTPPSATGGDVRPLAYSDSHRASGLGGTQVALADGSPAVFWNPAALGFAVGTEVQICGTFDPEDGPESRTVGLALAHPSRGTLGASLRYSANPDVGLLGSGDTRSELQARLAYGIRVSDPWSVGTAISLRRTGPSSRRSSGLGLDLGTSFRPGAVADAAWLDRTAVGLTLRNAVEPAFHSTGEDFESSQSTVDPLVLGIGATRWFRSSDRTRIVLAADLRATRGRTVSTHGGIEFDWNRTLALRSGLDDGSPTAGLGMSWRAASIDYAWKSADGSPEHRVGIRWVLSPVPDRTDFRRDLTSERAFDALRDKGSLRHQIATGVSTGRADDLLRDSLLLLQAVPDDAEARALAASCWKALGAEEEANGRAASAALYFARALALTPADSSAVRGRERSLARLQVVRDRTAHSRNRFAAALDAFAEGNLATAELGFSQLLATDPEDDEAAEMRLRVRTLSSHRVDRLMVEARSALEVGRQDLASAALREVLRLDRNAAGLPELLVAIAKINVDRASQESEPSVPEAVAARNTRAAKPQPKPPRRRSEPLVDGSALSEPEQRAAAADSLEGPDRTGEIDELARQARAAKDGGRLVEAVSQWEAILAIDPDHAATQKALGDEYLALGLDALADGELDLAIELWERAGRANPEDMRARGYRDWGHKQRERVSSIIGR